MNQYDARQQFIDGLDRYVSGIDADDGLQRLASNVKAYNDPLPPEACEVVSSIAWPLTASACNRVRQTLAARSIGHTRQTPSCVESVS
jgi:hypothetical protein